MKQQQQRKSARLVSSSNKPPATTLRKRAGARNGHRGNGSGNGHSGADGEGAAGGTEQKLFEAQPVIETLLGASAGAGAPRGRAAALVHELDKAQLLAALTALKKGDFSARLPIDLDGIHGKIADTFNDVVDLNQRMAP